MSRKISNKKHPNMIRKSIHSVSHFLYEYNTYINQKAEDIQNNIKVSRKMMYEGDLVKPTSKRYKCFNHSGTDCVRCGLKGEFFAKEIHPASKIHHMNLYGIDEEGDEVLLTADHIYPKSRGGKDNIHNLQTMCKVCNEKKGDSIEK